MLCAALLAIVALLPALTTAFPSKTCSAGHYINTSGSCRDCPAGTFNPSSVTSTSATTCTPCPAGKSQRLTGQTSCSACARGKFADSPGMSSCTNCPAGSFNNVLGAKSCCQCCAGTFQVLAGQTSCTQCPAIPVFGYYPYSAPGSNEGTDCKSQRVVGSIDRTSSCSMSGNTCPAVLPNTVPNPSPITRRKRDTRCPIPGQKPCPRFSGVGGFDCLDVKSHPESCGGCVEFDAKGNPDVGKDCTAIPGISTVTCVKGVCVVESCRKGWKKTDDGSACRHLIPAVLNQQSPRRHRRGAGVNHSAL